MLYKKCVLPLFTTFIALASQTNFDFYNLFYVSRICKTKSKQKATHFNVLTASLIVSTQNNKNVCAFQYHIYLGHSSIKNH